MREQLLRPPCSNSEVSASGSPPGDPDAGASASPQKHRRNRPGWKPTIVRVETFAALRAIQKSTSDPVIDMSYLADACLRIALDRGAETIVREALDAMGPRRSNATNLSFPQEKQK